MGTYTGAFVHQRCLRMTIPGVPLTVDYRPDVAPNALPGGTPPVTRDEVVVELGRLWDKSAPALQVLNPYTATIYKDGKTVGGVSVPMHWWFARWRWASAPRKMVRTVADLLASKWIPPYRKASALNTGSDTLPTPLLYVHPMDTAKIWWDGSTGMRPEIGLVTSCQADYIINGTASALTEMMSDAEVNASIAIHVRDETTGAPLNVQAHPYMTMLKAVSAHNPNFIDAGPVPINPATGKTYNNYRIADVAHHPDLCTIPYLLTDDPYFLEELQFTANYCIIETAWWTSLFKLPGVPNIGQDRGWAWSKRDMFRVTKFTPASPPSWLLPQSVWQKNLADCLTYANVVMASPAAVYKVYHKISKVGGLGVWQRGYDNFTLAHAVNDLGFTEWKAHYDWHIKGLVDLVSGTSGWKRNTPSPYSLKLFTDGFDSGYLADTSHDAQLIQPYSALWNVYKTEQGITQDASWNPDFIYDNSGGPDYLIILYSCIARAVQLGHSEAAAPLAWLKNAMPQVKHYDGTASFNCFKPKGWAKWATD